MLKNTINQVTIKGPTLIVCAFFIMQFCLSSSGQDENLSAPLPGSVPYSGSAKPQEVHQNIQPSVASPESDKEKSNFILGMSSDKYPISINALRALADKYKQEACEGNFDSDSLEPILAWLDELLKAHNKLAYAFAKHNELRPAYENECGLIRQLRGIKNETLYIKAQELIKAKKLKQAIPILIDITCSEPNSTLGLKAYQHLKQSGFSGEGNLASSKQADDLKANKTE